MMKGLLKKDFIMMQGSIKSLPFVLLIYVVMAALLNNWGMMMGLFAITTAGMVGGSMLADETYHWDKYVLTMPISRKQVIQSKFVLLILVMLSTAVIAVGVTMLITHNSMIDLLSVAVVLTVAQIMDAISIPCTIQWGYRHSRVIVGIGALFAGIVIVMLLFPLILLDASISQPENALLAERNIPFTIEMAIAGLAMLSAIVTAISYKVACRIYENKEF